MSYLLINYSFDITKVQIDLLVLEKVFLTKTILLLPYFRVD